MGVFLRWQRKIAITIYFRVSHRLYSSSAIIGDERDNIAVSHRVLGKYQSQLPLGITVKPTLHSYQVGERKMRESELQLPQF